MGVPVVCPDCGNRFYAPNRAEWQDLKCRKCGTIFWLEPHERRHSEHWDDDTGEWVHRYRETPIGDDYNWLVKLIGSAVFFLGAIIFWYIYPTCVGWVIGILVACAIVKWWVESQEA